MSDEEYEEYDLSEYTEQDFAFMDAVVASKLSEQNDISKDNAGPEFDLSEYTEQDFAFMDAAVARKFEQNDISKDNAGPAVQIELEHNHRHSDKSPLEFLSWKKYFSVTDLVSPVWCEVQYEYGLYGRRSRPLERRPSSFTSKTGKVIKVHHDIAQTNDKRLKRGKSVHQALEDELRPVKITVRAVSAEERFGLRLVQLIDGFKELTINGITRELPVFTIAHDQVVQGVIDEVFRSPPNQEKHEANVATSSPSLSPPKKKPRRFPSSNEDEPPHEKSERYVGSSRTTGDVYELRILDYKTRRSLSVPPDEETLSSRLQLMLYHRMLTSVLQPETFDFDLLWSRLNLEPTRPFSDQFLEDIEWKGRVDIWDCPVNLSVLAGVWKSTVHSERDRSGPIAVSPQLQLVYRRSAYAGKQQGNGKRKAGDSEGIDDPLEVIQEDPELARAIEESLRQVADYEAEDLTSAIAQMSEQAGPSSVTRISDVWKDPLAPSSSKQPDWQLELAIQESLLTFAYQKRVETPEKTFSADTLPDGPSVGRSIAGSVLPEAPETTSVISPIIGTKEFPMNEDLLDSHLTDVLQWWFGARPARGVDASQTNRCFTCEYRDSCEWREQKTKEAAAIVEARRAGRNGPPSD